MIRRPPTAIVLQQSEIEELKQERQQAQMEYTALESSAFRENVNNLNDGPDQESMAQDYNQSEITAEESNGRS